MAVVLYLCAGALATYAAENSTRVLIKSDVSQTHREELVARLRTITGLSELAFDNSGSLRFNQGQAVSGSEAARRLLAEAVAGPNFIVLADASSRSDVAFCRVVRGRWLKNEASRPPAYVVLIDFTDFHQLTGDAEARAAFDVGWGLLHEIHHVVHDSEDSKDKAAVGECEEHINQMRLELGLPTRADYFFTSAYARADANFSARYVRLPFVKKDEFSQQTKRFWLVWDAKTVGGLVGDGQRALVR